MSHLGINRGRGKLQCSRTELLAAHNISLARYRTRSSAQLERDTSRLACVVRAVWLAALHFPPPDMGVQCQPIIPCWISWILLRSRRCRELYRDS